MFFAEQGLPVYPTIVPNAGLTSPMSLAGTLAQGNAEFLAAATLIRPAPFDPSKEFAGISVEIESPEIFRLTLPDGSLALVAPGETTPKHATVHGLDVEGSGMRYVRVSDDLNEISGLGITHIAGIVTFDQRATSRLKRTPPDSIRVTTNTGFSLNNQWLNGQSGRVDAFTLDNQWQDVTAQCKQDAIPAQLVQEWSERNQRTLVDFRIST